MQEGCSAIEDFLVSQNQKMKVMAFEYIRALSTGKCYSTNFESNQSMEQMHRFTIFTRTIENVFQQLQERTLTDFYERMRKFASCKKSKFLMPVTVHDIEADGAQTTRRHVGSATSIKASSYAQS